MVLWDLRREETTEGEEGERGERGEGETGCAGEDRGGDTAWTGGGGVRVKEVEKERLGSRKSMMQGSEVELGRKNCCGGVEEEEGAR